MEFDRCPLAILRDASPDSLAWTEWAARMAVAKGQGCLRLEDYSAGELELVHIAEDIRDQARAEQISELGDGPEET